MTARTAPIRRGFSFVEILFAVMILGIGFIMLAALFPVAISQSQATRDEVAGTAQYKNSLALLRARHAELSLLMKETDTPDISETPVVLPFTALARPRVYSMHDPRITPTTDRTNLWNAARGSAISPYDPAAGATLLWARAGATSSPTILAFPIRSRNRAAFDLDDLTEKTVTGKIFGANVSAVPVLVSLKYDATGGSITIANITNTDVSGANTALVAHSEDVNAKARAVPGSYVVISDDRTRDDWQTAAPTSDDPTPTTCEAGAANGRVYRLGEQIGSTATSVTYAIDASTAMASAEEDLPKPSPANAPKAIGLLVGGRGYVNPVGNTDPAGFVPEGPAMGLTAAPQAVSIVP